MVSEGEIINLALRHITEFNEVVEDGSKIEKSVKNFKKRKGKNLLELLDSVDSFFSTVQSHIKTAHSEYLAKLTEFKNAKKQDEAKGAKKQDEAKSVKKQDETKSAKKQDETKSAKKQDEAKSAKKQDETKSVKKQDEAKSAKKHDETKSVKKQDETKSAKKLDDARTESPKPKKKEKKNKMKIETEDEELTSSKEEDNNVPKIRLVALDKLIDPSVKKSVTFDNSVIILTSSDEENSTPRKAKGHNGKLKSAMKKSPVSPAVKRGRSSDDEELSSQSKKLKMEESKRSSSRLKKVDEAAVERKRSLKIILSRTKDTNLYETKKDSLTTNRENRSESSSSSESTSLDEDEDDIKKDTTPSEKKVLPTRKSKEQISLKDIPSTSSSEDTHSSSTSDEDLALLAQTSQKKKKKDKDTDSTQSLDLHLSSSDEAALSAPRATKKTTKQLKSPTMDDEKLTWSVYIRLPAIECSKLKKYHEKRMEEKFKRLTSLKDLLRPFSPMLIKSKRSTKRKNKKSLSKEDEPEVDAYASSSDDESNNENKSSSPAVDEQVPDLHQMAAKILMDDVLEDNDKQTEETDKGVDKEKQKDSESETSGDEPVNTTEATLDSDASEELSEPEESSKKADDEVPEKEKSPEEAEDETSAKKCKASKETTEDISEKDEASEKTDDFSDGEKSSNVINEENSEETEPHVNEEENTVKEQAEPEPQGEEDQTIEEPAEALLVTEDDIFQLPIEPEEGKEKTDDDLTDIDETLLDEANPDDIEERMRLLTESPSFLAGLKGMSKNVAQRETTPEKATSDATNEAEKVPEDMEVNGDECETEETEKAEEETVPEKNDGESVGVPDESVTENNHKESASEGEDEKADEKAKESSDEESVLEIPDSDDDTGKVSDKESGNDEKESAETKKDSDSNSGDEEDSNSDKKKEWKKDKLLTEKIDSSDSDDDFTTKSKTKVKASESKKSKRKRKVISDSDESYKSKSSSESENEQNDSDHSSDDSSKKKKPRKRIRRAKDSSSEEEEVSTRKHIRKVLDKNSLSESTLKAESEEKQRKARIAEKQKKYNNVFEEKTDAKIDKLVLEWSKDKKEELLAVDPRIAKNLKPHQANGIQFMWDACFESLDMAKNSKGSGCILAHCMGLGKTLQVIALTHTLITNSRKTNVERVLVVCPVNTVLNWKAEFKKWMPKDTPFEIYDLICKDYERKYRVNEWLTEGGVMMIGYNMFRSHSNPSSKMTKKMKEIFQKGLVDPGPDLVICDEGHLLKNEKAHISIAMNRIKTARRIVLTGTPLQNNLKEYWCMVQFIKPNLLGTYKEYMNRFVNPITNGQYTDSTQQDIVLMRKRSHVLHKLLDGVVQRRDYSVLEPYLPPKYEYVVFVKLSEVQVKLYKHYMDNYARQSHSGTNKSAFLFADFQHLQRICTHPRVLLDKSREHREKDNDDEEESEGSLKDFIDDGSASGSSSSGSGSGSDASKGSDDEGEEKPKKRQRQRARVTRAQAAQKAENGEESDPDTTLEEPKEWWQEFCDGDELDNVNHSGKLSLLFHILKECEEIGDKVLIFSQSLYTLNCIEYFLERIDAATRSAETDKVGGFKGHWTIGLDYFRLDGSSSCDSRAIRCDAFNNPNNTRARLFLISTKAGGLGINLYAANRVIIFDVSWNPSHDIQSIYRVYRFGQKKPCYIYRFVTYGAMEMKVYERQVTKQAISKRVIDEQQIDRHYNHNDLMELYRCDLEPEERPTPLVPKDVLLGEMLQFHDKVIHKYHIHQSLLENKEAECLNEEERKAAWEEFENEKVLRKTYNSYATGINQGGIQNPQMLNTAMLNIVRRDNPMWSMQQVKSVIPAMVQQLQAQLAENNMALYTKIQQELYRMQVEKMQLQYKAQQNLLAQQRKQNALGNMFVNPNQFGGMYQGDPSVLANRPGPSLLANRPGPSAQNPVGLAQNDVIELND